MKKLIIIALILFSFTYSFSQNVDTKKPLSKEEKIIFNQNYKYISLELIGLDSKEKRDNLNAKLSNDPNFKCVQIRKNNFTGYVKRDYYDNITDFFKNQGVKIIYKNKHNKLAPIEGSNIIVVPENIKIKYIDTENQKQDKQIYTEAKKQLLIEYSKFI